MWVVLGVVVTLCILILNKQRAELSRTRLELRRYRRGLSDEIDRQFFEWSLTKAETEVAWFLVKGLTLREIARLREGSERTVRHQAIRVYEKAEVAGRAELVAFFLEEWMAPK